MRELCEADFHKPVIYESGRVWANAWDVFRCTLSRGGRGHRAAVDFVVCFGWGGVFRVFCFSSTAHGLLQVCCRLDSFTSILVMRPFLSIGQNSLLPLLNYFVCVCATFAFFTDCEMCTRPISTNPESIEASEYGLTRGARFVPRRLERWSRLPGCCGFRGVFWLRRDFVFCFSFLFFERTRPAAS